MLQQGSVAPAKSLPVYILDMFYGREYLFCFLMSAVLAMLPPSFCSSCALDKHGKVESLWFLSNSILLLNPEPSTVLATRKEMQLCPSWRQDRCALSNLQGITQMFLWWATDVICLGEPHGPAQLLWSWTWKASTAVPCFIDIEL